MSLPALVLTAGLATRLRPLSLVRAKAVLPVAGEPLVVRILRALRDAGIRDAVLNLHHLPASITAQVGEGLQIDMRVRYSWESPVLGSAGGPRKALSILGAGTFLIVNGDTLTDASIAGLTAEHARSRALVTMAVVPNTEPGKYGGVVVDDAGCVTGFVGRGSDRQSWHFVGLQAVEPEAFTSVPDDTPYESVGTLYPALIAAHPGRVRAFRTQATFFDIGTPRDYVDTSFRLAPDAGRATWWMGAGCRLDPAATLTRSILWDDVDVGPRARLDGCIVCDGVRVPPGAEWSQATVRVADGDLLPHEHLEGRLAVGPIQPVRPT